MQYHRVQSPPSDDFVDQMEKMCNSMVWSFGVLIARHREHHMIGDKCR